MDIIQSDVAIIGAGGSGLRAAIEIARSAPNAKITLISKVYPMRSHTVAAEGGSAGVVRDDDSLEYHFNDTVSGGAASDIILGDGSYFPSVRSRVNEGQELNIATGETYSFGVPVPLPINFNWENSSSHAQPEKERAYMLPPSGTKFEFSAYRTKWRLF